jgi:hypothetical protein
LAKGGLTCFVETFVLKQTKRGDVQALRKFILQVLPGCKLWFLDGKNSENKTVSNPNIGLTELQIFMSKNYCNNCALQLKII